MIGILTEFFIAVLMLAAIPTFLLIAMCEDDHGNFSSKLFKELISKLFKELTSKPKYKDPEADRRDDNQGHTDPYEDNDYYYYPDGEHFDDEYHDDEY